MSTQEKINIFTRFLKENGIYKEFQVELENHDDCDSDFPYFNIKDLVKESEFDRLIDNSFLWEETKHGHSYWSSISSDFEEIAYELF